MTKENKRTVLVFIGTFVFTTLSWLITLLMNFHISYIKWVFIYLLVIASLSAHIEIEKIILKKIKNDNP